MIVNDSVSLKQLCPLSISLSASLFSWFELLFYIMFYHKLYNIRIRLKLLNILLSTLLSHKEPQNSILNFNKTFQDSSTHIHNTPNSNRNYQLIFTNESNNTNPSELKNPITLVQVSSKILSKLTK